MLIIDATDTIMGRLASYCAKLALRGEEIIIVNAEKAVISGSKEFVFKKYLERRHRKSIVNPRRFGPKFPRTPQGILRRAIRGMLPYKQDKGKRAFKRIKVYVGVPKEFEGKEFIKLEKAHVSKLKIPKYVYLYELSKYLGAKLD